MSSFQTPGVYLEEVFHAPVGELLTGVPVFLALIGKQVVDSCPGRLFLRPLSSPGIWLVRTSDDLVSVDDPEVFSAGRRFEDSFQVLASYGYLVPAVRGFFENGGQRCYVQLVCFDSGVTATSAFRAGLETLMPMDTVDLVCAPDIMWPQHGSETVTELDEARVAEMQLSMLEHCELQGDRFAILDSLPGASVVWVSKQRQGLAGDNGALYYPWVRVERREGSSQGFIPPSGHIAGVYARTDGRVGVHKAPANEVLEGVQDLNVRLNREVLGQLNLTHVNCLRALPGRGIRVWGARTLSDQPAWVYVNVRRLFLTAARWIERTMAADAFEPNDARLWARIGRQLTGYFTDLYERGALKGRTAAEAFYVKCDAETNPSEVIEQGQVVSEIGLAPATPNEFVVVRIIQQAAGVSVAGPIRPG